jgi:plasmid stabilization system protein ParE
VVNKIRDTSRALRRFSNAGRVVPEVGDDTIRERFIYSYRLIYQVRGDNVVIVAVVHGRRLLDPLLDQIADG